VRQIRLCIGFLGKHQRAWELAPDAFHHKALGGKVCGRGAVVPSLGLYGYPCAGSLLYLARRAFQAMLDEFLHFRHKLVEKGRNKKKLPTQQLEGLGSENLEQSQDLKSASDIAPAW
jgi:hypothetical protein